MAGIAKERLESFIERIEGFEAEKRDLLENIRDVYGEAKSEGFDTKTLRQIVRFRRQEDYKEEMALLEMYKAALGMK